MFTSVICLAEQLWLHNSVLNDMVVQKNTAHHKILSFNKRILRARGY